MRVWRLAEKRYTSFDGGGARLAGGRWNLRGTPVVYTSASLALAVLEYSVNIDPVLAPSELVSIEVEIPDDVRIETLSATDLPSKWSSHPPPDSLAVLGTEWVNSASTAVLAVPSAVVPQETNFILNPHHRDFAKISLHTPKPFRLDPRILKK